MKKRGISLVEAMVSLLLLGLALGALASVIKSASSLSAFSSGKDSSLQAAQLALLRLRDESLQAVTWLSPNSAAPVSEVRFERMAPEPSGRLPVPPYPAPAGPWSPLAAAHRVTVRWSVQGDRLEREAGAEPPLLVASGVRSLEARFLANGNLQLGLTAEESQRTVTWKLEAALARSR